MAESLALLSIAARGEFPSALAVLADWLVPVEYPYRVVHTLQTSGLSARFPESALWLLDILLADWRSTPGELAQCLQEIAKAMPELRTDHRYVRLAEYIRVH
jgi:hypothetical protein